MIEYAHVIAHLDDSEHAVRGIPGKFEGAGDQRIARGLYELSLDSNNVDGQVGDVEHGLWIGRIGRFLVWQDSQGFFSYEVFDTDEAAELAYLGHEAEHEVFDE